MQTLLAKRGEQQSINLRPCTFTPLEDMSFSISIRRQAVLGKDVVKGQVHYNHNADLTTDCINVTVNRIKMEACSWIRAEV